MRLYLSNVELDIGEVLDRCITSLGPQAAGTGISSGHLRRPWTVWMSGGSSLLINQVAVASCFSKKDPSISKSVADLIHFYFSPAFSPMFWTFFKNTATTATTLKKIRENKRYLKIIEVFRGSSCGSSRGSSGSSRGSSRRGIFGTATNFNSLKSTACIKVAVVAVFFIRAYKSQLLTLLRVFLTIKNSLVAVGFIDNIFIFRTLKNDKKCNCYQMLRHEKRFLFNGWSFFLFRSSFLFNHLKNRLFVVCMRIVVCGFIGLVVKGLCQFCVDFRLWVVGHVAWNRPKKAKCKPKWQVFFTAHNYKKCGKTVFRVNRIKVLCLLWLKKSVIGFEFGQKLNRVLSCVRGFETHPPIKNSGSRTCLSHLLLFINCRGFIRVFCELCLSLEDIFVFRFRKVGGAGGV